MECCKLNPVLSIPDLKFARPANPRNILSTRLPFSLWLTLCNVVKWGLLKAQEILTKENSQAANHKEAWILCLYEIPLLLTTLCAGAKYKSSCCICFRKGALLLFLTPLECSWQILLRKYIFSWSWVSTCEMFTQTPKSLTACWGYYTFLRISTRPLIHNIYIFHMFSTHNLYVFCC